MPLMAITKVRLVQLLEVLSGDPLSGSATPRPRAFGLPPSACCRQRDPEGVMEIGDSGDFLRHFAEFPTLDFDPAFGSGAGST